MVLEELKEWLDRAIRNMESMAGTDTRRVSMRQTLRMVRQKITDLEKQLAAEPNCNCYICENQRPCFSGSWPVTCDKDGKTCDNYIERGSNNG